MHREFTVGYCRAVGERAGVTAWTGGVGGSSCRTCTQKACTYCKTPPWIYSGPFREIRCEKIKDRFAGSHCFCKTWKKEHKITRIPYHPVSWQTQTRSFLRERVIGMIFFPYFSQLQSVYYANLRNQPFLLTPRRLRDVSQGETLFTSRKTSQAARRGVRNGCFYRLYLPEGANWKFNINE